MAAVVSSRITRLQGVATRVTTEPVIVLRAVAPIDGSGFAGGQTDYMTGTGFFLGRSGGAYKFSIGDPGGNYLAWNGATLTVAGSISATSGDIGGFHIGASYITSNALKTTYDDADAGVYLGTDGIGLGTGQFKVAADGTLTATSGNIGSWGITSSYLGKESGVDATSAGMAPADYPFYAGAQNVNRAAAPFRVTTAGAVTATSGAIGGWTLGASSLTGGDATLAASGNLTLGTSTDVVRLSADDATYRLWAGHSTAASAPFSVTKGGAIKASSGTVGGWTAAASTLSAGNLTLDAGNTRIQAGPSGSTYVRMSPDGIVGVDAVLGTTFNLPTNGSAPTFASGIINSTVFNITSAGILETSATAGNGGVSGAGIRINDLGIKGWAASDATPKFFLDAATGIASLTGAQFQSAASGKRIDINVTTANEMSFWGDQGDGTIANLASIGIRSVGGDGVVGYFGNQNAGNNNISILAYSYSKTAIHGQSNSAAGVAGISVTQPGVSGSSNNNSGVSGYSNLTYGVYGSGVGGVQGEALTSGTGVYGTTASGYGVRGYASGSGTGGYFSTVSGYAGIFTGGNVGIGTTTPGSLLTVAAADPVIRLDGTSSEGLMFYRSGVQSWNLTSLPTSKNLALYNNGGTNSYNLVIQHGTGNVGIGTTTPGQLLQVKKNSTTGVNYIISAGGGTHLGSHGVGIGLDPEGYIARHKIGIVVEGDGSGYSMGKLHILLRDSSDAVEATLSDARMTFLKSGNVGVGTTTPGTLLEVYKDSSGTSLGQYPAVRVNNPNAAGYGALLFSYGSTQIANVEANNATGDLLVYTNSASSILNLQNSGGITFIGCASGVAGALYVMNAGLGHTLNAQWNVASNDVDMWINYLGYGGGTSYYRDLRIGDGKQSELVFIDGSARQFNLSTTTLILSSPTDATSTTTGSIQTGGGVGIAKALVVGGKITATAAGIDVPTSALGNTHSGTYTPNLSGVTNVASTSSPNGTYMRVGNVVHVCGYGNIDPTTTGNTVARVSLPIASNFANGYDCAGCAATTGNDQGVVVYADTGNDAAYLQWNAANTGNQAVHWSFSYRVI